MLSADELIGACELVLKKKHSKTGEESRFQGSLLGKEPENHRIVIDGGPKTIHDWQIMVKERAAKAVSAQNSPDQSPHDSQDTVMAT
jgi:transcription initiation factor TFIID subunit 3